MKVANSLLENCFSVIELLAEEGRSMRLSEIADKLGLQRSGTHRILSTLCGLSWVEQDERTELYRLTLKLPAVGFRFLHASQITDVCRPTVDRLAREIHELVRLGVVASGRLTTIASAQGARGSLVCQLRVFPTLPAHVTASGKAWLATLPDDVALKVVLDSGFRNRRDFGPNAVGSVDALLSELKKTRRQGFGFAREEAEPGVSSIAAVVRVGDESVAALAVVAPSFRLGEERVTAIAEKVKRAAAEISTVWPLRAITAQALTLD
ncbi:IclR family transcriptional regulator [Sinorhizobium sp. 8-89]|uniref:IclR family transcriptional regulator n=1 Tax=Sinorhizobium sp. 7-81 TaxID=3049087 RepID=UPI0024C448CE|nr:IclR family transcriptional regulator [Sinorhizobium sp. 7-81]MDK1389823.1 IclR family transcriptional regulator [Sinorhizobium sp. 7-81]